MKKGQIMEGIVEYVDFPNKGIVHTEEGKVIVKNAIPGQKVRFMINKKRKNKGCTPYGNIQTGERKRYYY